MNFFADWHRNQGQDKKSEAKVMRKL